MNTENETENERIQKYKKLLWPKAGTAASSPKWKILLPQSKVFADVGIACSMFNVYI